MALSRVTGATISPLQFEPVDLEVSLSDAVANTKPLAAIRGDRAQCGYMNVFQLAEGVS